jgi:hypothetical protein
MNITEQLLANRDCVVGIRLQGKEPIEGKLLVPRKLEQAVCLYESLDYEGFGRGSQMHDININDIVSVTLLPNQTFPIEVLYAHAKQKPGITW